MKYVLLLAAWSFAAGLVIMHVSQDCKTEKPQPVAQQAVFTNPILKPDATVQICTTSFHCGREHRYYAGMRK